ncbi:MAG: hypothetical protein EOM83_14175 [Clostridia bacterium]|nr:hypothetical protein [Clostridia bacterium]
MRKFYLTFRFAKSPISQSLSWTHYIHLMLKQLLNENPMEP